MSSQDKLLRALLEVETILTMARDKGVGNIHELIEELLIIIDKAYE